ncbi:MAG: cyclopropane fatty acyl phospholipid synthase [Candidatus Pacebacteria bacterium]|nr:cyclopropane fatty acyl phospholipid synthase [Candidatus Paceibacterota bacterium]
MANTRGAITDVFRQADIEIDGTRPWDIQVHDERLYGRLLSSGSLGMGEAYMEKWWDAERVDLLIERMLRSYGNRRVTLPVILLAIKSWIFNLQSRSGASKVIDEHYDLDNDLYASFLDPYMQYSCGYFQDTDDLAVAQEQKLDMICRKLQLKSSDRLLDIGCGWGGLAKYAAQKYGCSVVGITISDEQIAYAREFVKGLPVDIRRLDYRDLKDEQFDKIVSVGMLEHVGYKNYRKFMQVVHAALKDDGLFLLHTIGSNTTTYAGEAWSNKYIFPHGMLPSVKQLGAAAEKYFVLEDWHNFGPDYHKTLRAWDENFQKAWSMLSDRYSETFYRMFRYYFNSFAGSFKARHIQLWQIVYSKGSDDSAYKTAR